MQEQDEVCLCFHVTLQKLEKFIRVERPVRESQLSECFGAGTGCGWCRPWLKSIFEAAQDGQAVTEIANMDRQEYADQRRQYQREKKRSSGSDI